MWRGLCAWRVGRPSGTYSLFWLRTQRQGAGLRWDAPSGAGSLDLLYPVVSEDHISGTAGAEDHQRPDVLALRIGKALKSYKSPSQALIPFTPNAAGAPEWIIEHIPGTTVSEAHIRALPGLKIHFSALPL